MVRSEPVSLSPLLLLAALLLPTLLLPLTACSGDDGPKVDFGDTGGGGGGGGGTSGFGAVQCSVSPAIDGDTLGLRVGPGGVVWRLESPGLVYRYEREDTDGCSLVGEVVVGDATLEDVQDIELDAAGNLYALVFFDEVRRFSPEGAFEVACEVDGAHAIAPTADGSRVYAWPIGAEELQQVDFDADTCLTSKERPPLARKAETVGFVAGDTLVAATFDAGAEYPAGVVYDLADGSVRSEIGANTDDLVALGDLVPAPDGYWAVDYTSGELWTIAADGQAVRGYDPSDFLPLAGDPDPYLQARVVAYAGDDSYLAAGYIDVEGVWALGL